MKQTIVLLKRNLWLLALLFTTTSLFAQETVSFIDPPMTFNAPVLKTNRLTVSLLGDVNGDGRIDVVDVTALINMVLNGEQDLNGDMNYDNRVDVTDVTILISMVLNGDGFSSSALQKYLNGIYRSMRTAGWTTTGNTHQCFGISAYNLAAEVMGDDMIMGAQGSGWFWFDAAYNVKSRYTSNSWRSYDLWNAYYTWIANANYVLAATQSLNGAEANYIKGQAYAIRAYSYFMLAQWFARTYVGHEDDPCVPLYDSKDFDGSTHAYRSTVAEVYAQIDEDIDEAIRLLNGTTQQNPSHIGYAVALGLRARIALVEEDWNMAYNSASNAISASGKSVLDVSDFMGVNDATAGNVMWGAQIPADEVGMYASFWTHMMANYAYGQRAPKQISKWLYNKMSTTDARQAWWTENYTGTGSDALVQAKFSVKEGTEWEGDYIYMRVEEMYLTAAEAACRLGRTSSAKTNLNAVMTKRDPNYTCNKTGNTLGALTHDETGSLLEEILIQRRLELWGEDGRILTIRRLRQGFERTAEDGWPNQLLLTNRTLNDPESYPWVLTLPLAEFENYYSRLIPEADQNPIGDTYQATEDVERAPQYLTFVNNEYDLELSASGSSAVTVRVTRPNTSSKPYYALLRLQQDGYSAAEWYYVYFRSNQLSSNITIYFEGRTMSLGQHTYTLSLTDMEMSVANSSQLTSTRIVVDVLNVGTEGQHISFETANQDVTVYGDGYQEIPVTLTRAVTTHDYRASVTLSDASNPADIYLASQYVFFKAGESTANATLRFYETEYDGTYSAVLTLSDEDIATADPSLGEQITSTTVTLQVKSAWEPAGTCTFVDYTWTNGSSADNIPVEKHVGTNSYRIVDPLYAVYGEANGTNFEFQLNDDGTISVPEGNWNLTYWGGYKGYYDTTNYGDYCYIEQDGNTYTVHHLLMNGSSRYLGSFQFTWYR